MIKKLHQMTFINLLLISALASILLLWAFISAEEAPRFSQQEEDPSINEIEQQLEEDAELNDEEFDALEQDIQDLEEESAQ